MIDGSTVFTGGPVTIAVWVDSTEVVPLVLVPVTLSLIVEPTSAVTSTYVGPVEPPMSEHEPPAALQRRH